MLYRIVLSMCWKGTRKLTCPRLFLFSNLILVSDLLISWLLHHLLWATLAWTAWMRLKLSWLWKRYVTYTLRRYLYNLYLQEFSIVIPDVEADEIQTVGQGVYSFHVTWNVRWQFFFSAIDYIAKTPEGLFPFLNLSCFWLMEIFFPFTARWLKAWTGQRGAGTSIPYIAPTLSFFPTQKGFLVEM